MKKQKTHNKQQRQRPVRQTFFGYFFTGCILFLTNCTKEISPTEKNGGEPQMQSLAKAKAPDIMVKAGSSIQAAIDMAAEGSTIRLQPGIYQESLTVNKPGITIVGNGHVTLQNPGHEAIGITVQDNGDGFTLKNVTIRDFTERGVMITNVDGYLLSHVTVINDGEFGLFAEYCTNGTIEHCEGTGHDETDVFVGQSTHVTLTQNRMYANVIGMEVENSSYITVEQNHTYDNAVGIFCSLVPNRTVTASTAVVIEKNQVRENNHENFAAFGEQEYILPSGTGILILGTDNTLVKDNHVTGNKFTGIALISTAVYALIGYPIAGIDPNPDNTRIISNQVQNNGFDPQSLLPFPVPGVDLLWLPELGAGTANCWSKNVYSSSYPTSLPACN